MSEHHLEWLMMIAGPCEAAERSTGSVEKPPSETRESRANDAFHHRVYEMSMEKGLRWRLSTNVRGYQEPCQFALDIKKWMT